MSDVTFTLPPASLEACPGIEVNVWTPRGMDEITRVLR